MIFRAFATACVAATGFISSPALALAVPSPYAASFVSVPQIHCIGDKGAIHSGSGVRIGDNLIVTAAHVNSRSVCRTYDTVLNNVRFEPGADVAFVQGTFPDGFRSVVSCEGIREGEQYLALGYADGGSPDVEPLTGTSQTAHGQVMMLGHVYHGMSGGAVLNRAGALVAIINAMNSEGRPVSWVTPLTRTYLCGRNA